MSTHAYGAQQTHSPLICGQWTMVISFNFQSYRPLTPDQKKKSESVTWEQSQNTEEVENQDKKWKPTKIWAGVYFIKRFTIKH